MSLAFLSRKKSMFLFSLQYNSEAKVEKKDELVCDRLPGLGWFFRKRTIDFKRNYFISIC